MTEHSDEQSDDRAIARRESDRRGFLRTVVRTAAVGTAATGLFSERVGDPEPALKAPSARIPLGATGYADAFTSTPVTDRNSVVEGPDGVPRSLRVGIREGDHYGTAMDYRFAEAGESEPEQLHSRYSLYVPPGVDVSGDGKLPGPVGTYDTAGWGGRPSDGSNGWSARMGFAEPDGADGDVLLTSYVYHADMDGEYGTHFEWDRDGNGVLDSRRWYRIDNYVQLNAPGERDGVVRGWVDGDLALDVTDLRFRDVDRLRIQDYWFRVYYGGDDPSPADMAFNFGTLELWDRRLSRFDGPQ